MRTSGFRVDSHSLNRYLLCCLNICLLLLTGAVPATVAETEFPIRHNLGMDSTPDELRVFPVGLGVNGNVIVSSILVRGAEDGAGALSFEQWLVPVDRIFQVLNIEVTPLDSGQWDLQSTGLRLQVDPNELLRDSDLGLVLSIADIQTMLGVSADFDLPEYAIMLSPPWSSAQSASSRQLDDDSPVSTEGLPQMSPAPFTMTFAGQRFNVARNGDQATTTQGDLTVLGTLASGSWFLQLDQDALNNLSSWRLGEAQYLLEAASRDYAIGSQPTFWRSQEAGSYWGVTSLQRWNYDPVITAGSGGFNPNARLQADGAGRAVAGEASPGSFVRLVQGTHTNIVAETFVDSTGVYRFENVPQGGLYEVLIYPNGQLTAQPETQEVSFSTVPSQLPAGASALIASAGMRQQSRDSFFGSFENFSGGVAYRQGLSTELTLGAGVIYDEAFLGLGELFYQPSNSPLQLAASILGGGEDGLKFDADFVYQPSSTFRLDLNADDLSSRFRASWQALPSLGLRATGNTRDGAIGLGLTGYFNSPSFYGLASVDYLTNGNFRWNGLARYNRLELTSRGNEVSSNSNLLFRLTEEPSFTAGHFLRLGYETQATVGGSSLLSLGWRYQSKPRASDGRHLWAVDTGYSIGSAGGGPFISISTAVMPGLVLRARYEGVSAVSAEPALAIELIPFYNLQANLRSDDSRYDYFRRQGGLWIQPFIDTNNNRVLDKQENIFIDNSELLIMVDNQSIERLPSEIHDDGILIRMAPGMHRVDLDPAGYPSDLKPLQASYAVDVAAGSFTPVAIPFRIHYTVAGTVNDVTGQPVEYATVEAIPMDGSLPITTVTNGSGIYFLENLAQGTYQIRINQAVAQPEIFIINGMSDTLQEVNLTVRPE